MGIGLDLALTSAPTDGAAAGAGLGALFVALGQLSSTAGCLPPVANQLLGAAETIGVAGTLKQERLPGLGAAGWATHPARGATGTCRSWGPSASSTSPVATLAIG